MHGKVQEIAVEKGESDMLRRRIEILKGMPKIFFYNVGSILIQLIAINTLFLDAGIAVGITVSNVVFMMVYTVLLTKSNVEKRTCNKCGAEMPAMGSVCSSCGHIMDKPDDDEEMDAIMRGEDTNDVISRMEDRDRVFDRVEQMSAEKVFSISEDELENIFMQKKKQDETENGYYLQNTKCSD